VALDELLLAVNTAVRRVPDVATVQASVEEAAGVGAALGPLDPEQLHRPPVALTDPDVRRGRVGRTRFEELRFSTGLTLPPALASRSWWALESADATVTARVLRHRGGPRPWLVCVHGSGQGRAADLLLFRALALHVTVGVNVAFPVLPLHGPRAVPGVATPGFDVVDNVVAATQAVADLRRLLTWVRAQGDAPVGIHGVSFGGYVASLLVALEPGLDVAVVGIPVLGVPTLLARHLRRSGGRVASRLASLLGSDEVAALDRLVSPLALPPRTPFEGRYVFGALGDRVTTPRHTLDLWDHWDRPAIRWYPGGHVGHLWSTEARSFVHDAVRTLAGAGGKTT
jgi:pimeloyl-ACP methyl ester carboxylesterase